MNGQRHDFYCTEGKSNLRLYIVIGVMVTSPLWFVCLSVGLHWVAK